MTMFARKVRRCLTLLVCEMRIRSMLHQQLRKVEAIRRCCRKDRREASGLRRVHICAMSNQQFDCRWNLVQGKRRMEWLILLRILRNRIHARTAKNQRSYRQGSSECCREVQRRPTVAGE